MSDGESSDGEVDFRPTLDIESLPKVPGLNCLKGFTRIIFCVQCECAALSNFGGLLRFETYRCCSAIRPFQAPDGDLNP
jgi:hypothetical protein